MSTEVPGPALLTREEMAWTIDNRGSLAILQKHKRHADGELHTHFNPRYRVVDKNVAALRLLQHQFGGTIFRHSGRHYAWEIGETTLAALLGQVVPYLREKRRHAELILELVETKQNGNDREGQRRIVEEVRWLNARGWTLDQR